MSTTNDSEEERLGPCSVCLTGASGCRRDEERFCHHQVDPSRRLFYQLTKALNWGIDKADKVLDAYAGFMTLKVLEKDCDATKLSPTGIIDQVWHAHVLDTKAYRKWIESLVESGRLDEGDFLDHDPLKAINGDDEARKARSERTVEAYVKHFGVKPKGDLWEFECLTGLSFIRVRHPGGYVTLMVNLDAPVSSILPKLNGQEGRDLRVLKCDVAWEAYELNGARIRDMAVRYPTTPDPFLRLVRQSEIDARLSRPNLSTVNIKTLYGRTIAAKMILGQDTVEDMKDFIDWMEGTPVDQQRLIFAGMQMEDGRRLSDYKVSNNSTIQLVLRLKGC